MLQRRRETTTQTCYVEPCTYFYVPKLRVSARHGDGDDDDGEEPTPSADGDEEMIVQCNALKILAHTRIRQVSTRRITRPIIGGGCGCGVKSPRDDGGTMKVSSDEENILFAGQKTTKSRSRSRMMTRLQSRRAKE